MIVSSEEKSSRQVRLLVLKLYRDSSIIKPKRETDYRRHLQRCSAKVKSKDIV